MNKLADVALDVLAYAIVTTVVFASMFLLSGAESMLTVLFR